MREEVLRNFPQLPSRQINLEDYLSRVEEKYIQDAYHSLSIEGYRVNVELIEKVRTGDWDPDLNKNDKKEKNALAARGYWLAFQAVKQSIKTIIQGKNAGEVVKSDHSDWYRNLFSPSVISGILEQKDLAGYRSNQVYIRRSHHVPPNVEAVRDLMPALFDLLKEEQEASVRIVLGHFFFVYIHPYLDGNGRLGRFLMNAMCASGGYSWTIIPVEQRDAYMKALEEASVRQNIKPFCLFLSKLIEI
jgi:Fic family protein